MWIWRLFFRQDLNNSVTFGSKVDVTISMCKKG
jgi:hypothetical protein